MQSIGKAKGEGEKRKATEESTTVCEELSFCALIVNNMQTLPDISKL